MKASETNWNLTAAGATIPPSALKAYHLDVSTIAPIGWNDVLQSGECDSLKLFQTTEYAALQGEYRACAPSYLTVTRFGIPVLRLVLFTAVSELPVGSPWQHRLKSALSRISKFRKTSIFWWGQPVRHGEPDLEAYKFLSAAIDRVLAKESATLAFGQWPAFAREALPPAWQATDWATLNVDLTSGIEQIRAKFRQSARKAIRQAERAGITVERVADRRELPSYFQFARDCAKRYGTAHLVPEAFDCPWRHLHDERIFETFVARHDGHLIAGLSVWGCHDKVMELGSYQSEDCYRLKLPGPDLIKWEIIKWARCAGIRTYDLAGINPKPLSKKEAGIRQFKEKWGGTLAPYLMVAF